MCLSGPMLPAPLPRLPGPDRPPIQLKLKARSGYHSADVGPPGLAGKDLASSRSGEGCDQLVVFSIVQRMVQGRTPAGTGSPHGVGVNGDRLQDNPNSSASGQPKQIPSQTVGDIHQGGRPRTEKGPPFREPRFDLHVPPQTAATYWARQDEPLPGSGTGPGRGADRLRKGAQGRHSEGEGPGSKGQIATDQGCSMALPLTHDPLQGLPNIEVSCALRRTQGTQERPRAGGGGGEVGESAPRSLGPSLQQGSVLPHVHAHDDLVAAGDLPPPISTENSSIVA